MDRATCRSCGAALVWRRTAKGNAIPLDAEPVSDGNVLDAGEDSPVVILAVGGLVPLDAPAGVLRVSHLATCPDAAKCRRRAGAR